MAQEARDASYRVYVTDSIFYQAQNKRLTVRFADALRHEEPEDIPDGDAIVADILRRAGLVVADGSFSADSVADA